MLLGFKKRFIDPIKIGTKVHTLRNNSKRKPKIGEFLHMYSGLRTKYTEHISSSEKLISKQKAWIKIVWQENPDNSIKLLSLKICVDGKIIGHYNNGHGAFDASGYNLHKFVQYDGFTDFLDFVSFWINPCRKQTKNKPGLYKIVKSMNLYHWTDLRY